MKRCWGMHCRPAVRGMVLLMVLVWLCGSAMAATWTHQTTGSWEYWYRDGLNKFRFNNTTGQWWHYGALGTWQTLSGTGLTYTGNIGDGGWYNLGTGFTYRYYDPYDTGYFQQDGKWRFRYGYQLGQWYNTGDILSWQTLGAAGQSGAFIGSGAWYALGNGFSYKFYAPQNAGYFKQGDDYRFLYLYGTGEWRHTGDTALSWRSLGGVGQTASFLGDGLWHDLGNGVSYCFMTGGYSSGYFKIGTSYRFKYQYGPGQWFHTGNTVSWQRLGGSGESALFMGDGYWHNIGNGFTYRYYAPQDAAYIKDGAAYRFLYLYGPQEWRHTGNTLSWRNLGGIGQTASFMGDGAAHDLGNGFMYSYLSGQGYWKLGAASRFRYDYAAGQWAHIGAVGGWTPLGPAGWSASFVGDGSTYDLGNGFTYSYTLGTDTGGYFQAGLTERFRYVYGTGGWFHYGQFGGWQSLASGLGAQFVGDGGSYSLGNGFTYTYSALTNTGSWLSDALGFTKFAYDYAGGQWYDYDKFANQYALGAAGNSVGEFMGDGTAHVLDAIWSYLFDGAVGQWQTGGSTRFRYAYATGQWSHDGPVGGAFALSAAGLTGQFIGSYTGASPADLGNGFSYWHDAATGVGHWLVAGISFFDYDYAAGRWSHYGPVGGAFALSAANVNAGFVGDGSARDLGNGFLYSYGAGEGTWSLGTANRFSYNYATGQWSHMGAVGGWVALGSPGWNASFIGEGSHDLGNGFTYAYNALGDFAGYLQGGTTERFRYAYGTGDWTHFDWSNAPWLLASARPADFVGTSDPAGINLGNGFAYRYASNVGYWMVGGANRFNYDYTKGTWSHYGFGTGPIALTAAGTSGQFIGDGQTLPFDANFSYWYELATDRGHWVLSGTAAETFGYDYATGQWNDYIASRGWRSLGEAGQSLSFIGDGAAHNLGGNLRYTYDLAAGLAYYYFDPIHQFRQSYTTAVMEYLHDTNVWSTWSANTAPPGTFSGVSAAPSSSSYMGIAGGSVWFITSNMLYRWDGNSFQTLAPSGTFTSLTALGNAGGNQYFLGYGGTSGAGYDIYQYDGTTFQEISGNKNYGTTTWVGAIGNVPYFRINGGTGHTGWDLFNFSGNTFNNLSNMGFTTMDLLVTAGGSFYFNGNGGTGHTGRDLFSWNGTWNQLSNGSYGGSIAYLASLDSQLFFRVSDNDLYGWYHLYSWNGTWNNISGAPQYSVVTYIGNIGNEAFFQMLGGGHTGRDLYSSDGTTFNTLSNWNFSQMNGYGIFGNSVWIIGYGGTNPDTSVAHTNNDLFVWNSGTGFVQASSMGFSAPTTHLATVGDTAFFSLYGGTGHTGSDLFVLNGTTLTQAASFGVAPAFVTSLGTTDAFFRITGGTGHTGTDIFRWSGGSLANISNMGASSITYLTSLLGTDLYFSVNGGTGHTGYDVFRWNTSAGWTNVSNVGASALTYLSTLGPDLYFSVMGGSTGSGYDLYRWNGGTFTDVSGDKNFSTLSLFAQDGNTGFFLGILGTDRGLYRWNGSAFTRMDTAGPSSIAAPYVIYNGDVFYFQYGRVGGPTTVWFPSLLWNSYFDFLNSRI